MRSRYDILVSGMAYDDGKSGISQYMNHVVAELARHHRVTLLLLKKDVRAFPAAGPNLTIKTVPDLLAKPLVNMCWHLFVLPALIPPRRYDFVFLPAGNRRVLAWYRTFTVTTVHDFSQLHVDGKYDRFRTTYVKRILPHFLKKADALVAISESTARDVSRLCGTPVRDITVIYNGYDRTRFKRRGTAGKPPVPGIGDRHYLLYVARIEHPGKNHLALIRAYGLLPEALKERYHLVLAGSLRERSGEVLEYAGRSADRGRIHFPGFVGREELPALYGNASVFVFPSLYEGFGLPVVEAFASGVPVVCSDRGPLKEVGGDAALYFDPERPDEIAAGIATVLTEPETAEAMVEKGLARTEKFSWERHAEAVVGVYERNK